MDVCDHFINELNEMGVVKTGQFKLKTGMDVPVYFDSRVIPSNPNVLKGLSAEIANILETTFGRSSFDVICGVPYTAMSFAVLAAQKLEAPLIIKRKEPKNYGTMTVIDGKFKKGDRVIIIEDTVTSGTSIIEVAHALENEGLNVVGAVALLNREQGGAVNLENAGFKCSFVFNASDLLNSLLKAGYMDKSTVESIISFLHSNPISLNVTKQPVKSENGQNGNKIVDLPLSPGKLNIGRRIFEVIRAKKTNLCFSIDVEKSAELLKLANALGPYVCAIKTHVDALKDDFDVAVQKNLVELATKHNFLIIEDRKLADIGAVSRKIFNRICEWADLVTVHALPGIDQLKAMAEAKPNKSCGILMIAQMSCDGNLVTPAYTKSCVDMSRRFPGFVAGFIAQYANDISGLHYFHGTNIFAIFTPGVNLSAKTDPVGQRYSTPEEAIKRGTDVIIVGRGILDCYFSEGGSIDDAIDAVEKYRAACFEPYKACHAYELG